MARMSRKKQSERLDVLAGRLHQLATETVGRRQPLEDRWLRDFRQLEGRYDPKTEEQLDELDQSKAFANQTRPKTDAAISRLLEIIFPQDEDNFDIQPTPAPELADMVGSDRPTQFDNPQTGEPVTENDFAMRIRQEAKKRAKKMKEVIKDQLAESDWPIVARNAITAGCEIGTGVVQGPIVQGRARTAWVPQQLEDGNVVHEIQMVEDIGTGVESVNTWNFFPDMSARRMKDAGFVFIRHRYNKRGMRELAKQPGFNREVMAELIEAGPWQTTSDTTWGELREVTGVMDQGQGRYWEFWEYHGQVDDEDLDAAGIMSPGDRQDPLRGILAEVWFCDGRTAKFNLNPLEPQTLPFHVFNYDVDPTCIFGRGIPYRIRNSQSSANASWRMAHDNGALTAGGQIIMDKDVTAAPGYGHPEDRKLTPRKVWLKKDPRVSVKDAFGQFTFDGQINELLQIYGIARNLIDEESGFPAIVQGDAQSNLAQNATGLTVLSNLALTLMRRPVRNFDDEVINPLITSFYNWNMAHHEDPMVKGDYAVVVRGSKYLVTKEIRAQNAVWLAQQALTNPMLVQFADPRKAFKALVHAAQHEPEEWMVSEALQDDDMQPPAEQPPDPAVVQQEQQMQMEQQKFAVETQLEQAKLQIKQMEIQQREMESRREMEMKAVELAIDQNISMENARAQLATEAMRDQTKNREMDIKLVTGQGI